MLEHITTHDAEAQAYFIEQFKNSQNLRDLISIYMVFVQELEDVFQDIITQRMIDGAEGAQLDGIGEIVGQSRDADYHPE